MKKIAITVGVLLSLLVIGWVYLANKFEQIAKEEILPRIKDNVLVSADADSAIIAKFKFKITFNNITIFPKSKSFQTFNDQLVICYNPFNDQIIAQFTGDKFKSGSGATEVHFTAKNKKVEFNRSLLNNKFENINILISTGEANSYFANDNLPISHLKNANINLISKLDKEGFYNIDLKFDIGGIESNPESKYLKYVFEELVPNLAQEQSALDKRFEKIEKYFKKIYNKLGPIDYHSESFVRLDKKHVKNIIAALNGELKPVEIYKNFGFTSENYLLSIKESYSNPYTFDSFSYKLVGNGSTITSDLNMLLTKNYNDTQKKEIADLLVELANSITTDQNISSQDIKGLLDKYLDTKKINLSFNIGYDVESRNTNHSLEFVIGDLNINSNGSLKEQKYDGNLTLITPKLLISEISHLYDGGIKLLMQREGVDTNHINLIVENIKNNGIEFLSAFDKKDSIKEDNDFEATVSFNLENFAFKINDKEFSSILKDERIIKFIEGMPNKSADQNP